MIYHMQNDYDSSLNHTVKKNFLFLIISDLQKNTVMKLDLLTAWDFDKTLSLYFDHDQDLITWIWFDNVNFRSFFENSIQNYMNIFINFIVSVVFLKTAVLFVLISSLTIRLLAHCFWLCFLFFSCNVLYTIKIS